MAKYYISGVWKKTGGVITHYAFHRENENSISRAVKMPKADAIRLLNSSANSGKTWIWNYNLSKWVDGEEVEVVDGKDGKYLRSNPNDRKTDNLAHLIDYDWISL